MIPSAWAGLISLLVVAPSVPTLPVSALRPGEKAVVRTVFAGDSIETFDAEILGVLSGGRTEGDLILARATTPRVVELGVAQGMSGSPVYVDGKLIGALSSGWAFSREPIFGITPIGEMLQVLEHPDAAATETAAGPAGADVQSRSAGYRGLAWSDDTLARPPAPDPTRPGALPIPLAAGGLDPGALPAAKALFEPLGFTVTPGGRAQPSPAPARLEPGSPVAVDILRGDLNLSAIGTVTYVDGDRVLIFGHPFFQSGDVRLPMSTAHIVGILPSLANSFKLGVPGSPVGVVTQDRRSAVAGRLGGEPHLMPFRVEVLEGGRRQSFRFETIEDRTLLPSLVATAAMNSVLESGGASPMQTVRWTLRGWRGGRAFQMHDVAAGEGPLPDMIGGVTGPLRVLYANPFARFAFDSALVSVALEPGRNEWTLRAATLGAPAVRPGRTLAIHADVEHWRGERRTLTLELPVPHELPDGHYILWIGGADEFDRYAASRVPARYRPVSVEDALQRLAALRSSDSLYVEVWARSPEVSSGGDDLSELPGSALALLAPTQAAGDRGRRTDWAMLANAATAIPGTLHGELIVDLVVNAKAP